LKLVAHKSFKRAFQKLIKKNPQLQGRVLNILDLLENDPFTPYTLRKKIQASKDNL
jgi:mRNA interferase YafQ